MKATDNFKKAIENHLNQLAEKDSLFAETLKKENKNIDDCCTYILNQVQESGRNGFEDSEIYGMAVHYYDEDDIKPGKSIKAKVVVNHVIELSEEEKAEAKKKAMEKAIEEEKEKMKKKREAKKPVESSKSKPSLFDML